MRRNFIYFLLVTGLHLSIVPSRFAQEKPSDKSPAASAPASGYRAEFLEDVAYYEQRYTRLAEAMPADKYAWRPSEGVRSVGEVYTHILRANYGVARALGTPPPAGFDFKAVLALSGDKAKVQQALNESFAHFRRAILALSAADARQAAKNVQPRDDAAWRLDDDRQTLGRALGPVDCLRACKRRSSAVDRRVSTAAKACR